MFDGPQRVDVTKTVEVPTPESWREALAGLDRVPVLRLADPAATGMPGWCTAEGQIRGPETEIVCGGINTKLPSHAAIWRQGNLLHWGFEPDPDHLEATGRNLLVNGIAYIARFVDDRPLVRSRSFADPAGSGPSRLWLDRMLESGETKDLAELFAAPWQERIAALDGEHARAFVRERLGALCADGGKFTFDEDALALDVDLNFTANLPKLVDMLGGEQGDRARALLERRVACGPPQDTTQNNWRSWLRANGLAVFFDPISFVYRKDELAHWRHVATAVLRGPTRADGAPPTAEAAALAAKIEAHAGGRRALDDLHTFAFRLGEVRYFLDRDRAILRLENSAKVPAGNFATVWDVVIFDCAADIDLRKGGGPPPRPWVSGRVMYREAIHSLLLPLLLREPGTTLRLLPDDEDGLHVLGVRLGLRCMDPTHEVLLHVGDDGVIEWFDGGASAASRTTRTNVTATTQVGPLLLPTGFQLDGRRPRAIVYEDLVWNPPPPAGFPDATERILK